MVGALAWVVQPLYVLVELVAAASSTAPYSLRDNTISDLGALTCTQVGYPYGPVPVCSPLHDAVNASFVGFGLLIAAGATLLRRHLGRGGWAVTAWLAFLAAGLGSVGSGLTPLDQQLELHALVSTPTFVAQPLALLAAGAALRRRHRWLAASAVATGVLTLLAAAAFFALALVPQWGGLVERLALWPAYVWLLAAGVAVLRRRLPPV